MSLREGAGAVAFEHSTDTGAIALLDDGREDFMNHLIHFGSRIPWRGIWASIIMAAVLIVGFGIFSLGGSHPELTWMVSMFLLIPLLAIPLLIAFNQYAVVDRRTWLISINGGEWRPLSFITHCRVNVSRGINTMEFGYTDRRKDRFMVSSFTPFASPFIEREWVRYLLPYMGLPRDPNSRLSEAFGAAYEKHATMEQAQHFAYEYLK